MMEFGNKYETLKKWLGYPKSLLFVSLDYSCWFTKDNFAETVSGLHNMFCNTFYALEKKIYRTNRDREKQGAEKCPTIEEDPT